LPYIQPHEFESLLFADISRLAEIEPAWATRVSSLTGVRALANGPEYIDDGPTTHPSARLSILDNPRYRKVLHGPLITAQIGLERIRAECAHFASWLHRLERLAPLQ
jgi:hypothetical protein